MSRVVYEAFHFESLVWDWPIAVYLFFAGISAGAVLLAIIYKRQGLEEQARENAFIRSMAIIAPLTILAGLTILIFHLTKPMMFWKIMLNFNFTSVMSMGVILFQIYQMVLFAWLAVIFEEDIMRWIQRFFGHKFDFVGKIIRMIGDFENAMELFLAFLAILLGVYTGFLLSALKTYPLLNNPVLPILFLFSGISSGAAACMLMSVTVFKDSPQSHGMHFLHRIEKPVVLFELLVLVAFFTGMIFGGGAKQIAAMNALAGGFWSAIFWIGIIGVGMLTPLAMNQFASEHTQHQRSFVIKVTLMSLTGVLLLRTFILYAGQMSPV